MMTETVTATEETAHRVWLTDDEATALIEAARYDRTVPLAFGPSGIALMCLPGTRWAVQRVLDMRGLAYTPSEGPDPGIIDEKRRGTRASRPVR